MDGKMHADSIFDALFAQAVIDNFYEEYSSLPSLGEMSGEYTFSKKHEKRMKALFVGEVRKERIGTFIKVSRKIAAAFLIILMITGALMFITSRLPPKPVRDTWGTSGTTSGGTQVALEPYYNFERALREITTDVVIAQYVGHKILEVELIEYEFVVLGRLLGNATDRIYVYEHYKQVITIVDSDGEVIEDLLHDPEQDVFPFDPDTEYLLPLRRISTVYARRINENIFWFASRIIIDLNDVTNSTISSGPLSEHSTGFNFNKNATRSKIIWYVYARTRLNPPARDIIRSEAIKDIINESPHIVVIEIGEPRFLASELEHGGGSDISVATDSYYVTVNRILKGSLRVGDEIEIKFFAETVFTGEQHIVAIEPISQGSSWYNLTSRNSLFRLGQFDEIITIIKRSTGVKSAIWILAIGLLASITSIVAVVIIKRNRQLRK